MDVSLEKAPANGSGGPSSGGGADAHDSVDAGTSTDAGLERDGSVAGDAYGSTDASGPSDASVMDVAPRVDSGVASDSSAVHAFWSESFGVSGLPTTPFGLKVDGSGNILLLAKVWGVDFGDGPLTGAALVKFDPSGTPLWSTSFEDQVWATRVLAVDGAGDAVVCERSSGDSSNPGAIFVTKFHPDGTPMWNKSFATTSNQTVVGSCAADFDGNVYVGGRLYGAVDFGGGSITATDSNGDLVLAKLAALDGSHLWSKPGNVPSGGGMVQSISVDGSGNPVVTGWSAGSFDFGAGPVPIAGGGNDAFVAKLTPDGTVSYAKMFGGTGMQECYGVADSAGGVAMAGLLYGSMIDFGDGPVQGPSYYARLDATNAPAFTRALVATQDGPYPGDLVVSGNDVQAIGFFRGTTSFGLGDVTATGDDIYVIRLDPVGTTLGARTFARSGSGDSGFLFIAAEPDGDVVITGSFPGTIDLGTGTALTAIGASDLFLARIAP